MNYQIEVYGHRGWPRRFPDNTLAGLLAAASIADGVEVDVRRSGDGKLVLSHDDTLGEQPVWSTPWEVLGEIDLGGGARPCLFDEAVSSLPSTPLIIEVKNLPGAPGFEPDHRLALEAAERARPGDVVTSFNHLSVTSVARHFPEVTTGLNVSLAGDLGETAAVCVREGHGYLIADLRLLLGHHGELPPQLAVGVWSPQRGDTFAGAASELVSRGVSCIISDDPQATRSLLGATVVDQG